MLEFPWVTKILSERELFPQVSIKNKTTLLPVLLKSRIVSYLENISLKTQNPGFTPILSPVRVAFLI